MVLSGLLRVLIFGLVTLLWDVWTYEMRWLPLSRFRWGQSLWPWLDCLCPDRKNSYSTPPGANTRSSGAFDFGSGNPWKGGKATIFAWSGTYGLGSIPVTWPRCEGTCEASQENMELWTNHARISDISGQFLARRVAPVLMKHWKHHSFWGTHELDVGPPFFHKLRICYQIFHTFGVDFWPAKNCRQAACDFDVAYELDPKVHPKLEERRFFGWSGVLKRWVFGC